MEIKAPAAVLDWPISWSLSDGETISGSTWSVTPVEDGGVAVVPGSPDVEGTITSCLLSGGIFRRVYTVANLITTSQGRSLEQTVTIRIGQSEVSG